jgi:hypothetical protein
MEATTKAPPAKKSEAHAEAQARQAIIEIKRVAAAIYDAANAKGYDAVATSIAHEFGFVNRKDDPRPVSAKDNFKAGYLEDAQKKRKPIMSSKRINFDADAISKKIEGNGRFATALDVYVTLMKKGDYALARKAAGEQKLGMEFERTADWLDNLNRIVNS